MHVHNTEVVLNKISCSLNAIKNRYFFLLCFVDSIQWIELMSFRHKLFMAHDAEVTRTAGQNIGLSFGEVTSMFSFFLFVLQILDSFIRCPMSSYSSHSYG